jgi:hypothetical protein
MAAAGTCSVAAGISHTGAAAVEKPDPGPRSLVCVKCGKVCNSTGALGRHMGSKACKALASGIDLSDVKVRRQFYDELRASSVGAQRKQQPPPLQRPEEYASPLQDEPRRSRRAPTHKTDTQQGGAAEGAAVAGQPEFLEGERVVATWAPDGKLYAASVTDVKRDVAGVVRGYRVAWSDGSRQHRDVSIDDVFEPMADEEARLLDEQEAKLAAKQNENGSDKRKAVASRKYMSKEPWVVHVSAAQCSRELDVDASSISRVCRGMAPHGKGYEFKFVDARADQSEDEESSEDELQCPKNPYCVRPRKHPGLCKIVYEQEESSEEESSEEEDEEVV